MRHLALLFLLASCTYKTPSEEYPIFRYPLSSYANSDGPLTKVQITHKYWDTRHFGTIIQTDNGGAVCSIGAKEWSCYHEKNGDLSCVMTAFMRVGIMIRYSKPPTQLTLNDLKLCAEADF